MSLHPLLREFGGSLLSDRQVEGLRHRCAVNLCRAYGKLDRLEAEYQQRNVDPIIADLSVAVAWARPGHEARRLSGQLRLLLDKERHNLQLRFPAGALAMWRLAQALELNIKPMDIQGVRCADFAQQIAYRAHRLGFQRIAKGIRGTQ